MTQLNGSGGAGSPQGMEPERRTVRADGPLASNLLAFLRGLRRLGFQVGTEEAALVLRAVAVTGWDRRDVCRDAIQCIVVRHPEQVALFRAAWEQFLLGLTAPTDRWLAQNTLVANIARMRQVRYRRPEVVWIGQSRANERVPDEDDAEAGTTVVVARGASRQEVLRRADFARLTPLEQREMMRWRQRLPAPKRLTRRREPNLRGRELDVSATLRRGGLVGEWFVLVRRRRRWAPRPVVLICDVSGSMDPYSRMLLRFAHTLMAEGVRLEAFVFSTRLTRITRPLRLHDPDRALEDVMHLAPDFAGGTRLGDALQRFNREWARRVLRQRAVVLLATDGFDTGDAQVLAQEVRRLARLSHRLIWLNPGLADPSYTPSSQGARVLAGGVDEILPAYSWQTLEDMWERIARTDIKPRVRRQWYDDMEWYEEMEEKRGG